MVKSKRSGSLGYLGLGWVRHECRVCQIQQTKPGQLYLTSYKHISNMESNLTECLAFCWLARAAQGLRGRAGLSCQVHGSHL